MSAGQAELVDRHDRLGARGDGALGRLRVEVERARVDVGEDRRRAALPDRVGGRDERHRRHDHLVAGADARRRAARAAARSCSWRRRRPRPRRRARRTPPRTRARAGPGRPSRWRSPSATASPSSPRSVGRLNGISITRLASERVGWVGTPARSPRHHSTRRVSPSSRSTSASKPSSSRASSVSASRRVTPLTARAGPCSTGRSEPITRSSISASSSRLVSVPLATL